MSAAAPLLALGGAVLVVAATRRRSRAASVPACVVWAIPSPVPPDVVRRAIEILATGAGFGATFEETWGGRLYKFTVETHGPNPQNPRPHKGVGVRVCARTEVPEDGGR